ncbi:histidinol-phosphate aminotransferase [Sporosarcina sp. NCCP-2716]|uniref:histidinol-phosphate transaminase n=1 Tax=Sporosarcina sp. NCCP-2716 TaxID=2943679 RepID=UPI002041062F|nr:histidinol-phosphate transaminase [Sporosarcina sp. NCCP-2716]GKV67953.1 histidinol-phosphate aminotransferase [Sporosarcina sp. NCCP-2716]
MNWKPALSAMKPYKPGRSAEDVQKEYGIPKIEKLASNENPYGCAPSVRNYLENAHIQYEIYPETGTPPLRTALAGLTGVEESAIILGNGSDDLITIISRALLAPGTSTIMPVPTFPQYAHNARIEGAEVREIPLEDGVYALDRFLEAIDDTTAVIWICTPNNPTGGLLPSVEFREFLEKVPSGILVVADEAYFEYITDSSYENPVGWLSRFPNLIILRTFSKAYGLAAFRLGYGISSPAVIAQLTKVRNPFNTNSLALAAAGRALEDQDFIAHCRQENAVQRTRFRQFAAAHKLRILPSEANFVLLEVPMDADEAADLLMQRGYIIRSGNLLGTPGWLRVTVGTATQNDGFFSALAAILEERGHTG